jgi:hypothetical protein
MAITSNGFNPTDSPCPLVLACALRLAFSIQLTLVRHSYRTSQGARPRGPVSLDRRWVAAVSKCPARQQSPEGVRVDVATRVCVASGDGGSENVHVAVCGLD